MREQPSCNLILTKLQWDLLKSHLGAGVLFSLKFAEFLRTGFYRTYLGNSAVNTEFKIQ